MKSKKRAVIVTVFILILLAVCVCFGPYIRNNILLERYAAQLHTVPLPPDTTEIARDKAVGNLYGTGNHLDFAATIEIESSLSESELFDYYSTNVKDIKSVEELSIFGMDTWLFDTSIDHSFQTIEVIPKN